MVVSILIFFFGLCVGSFLNVLIDRLPKEEQIFFGRSYCDHCHHQLAWFDLIPLLSFAFLKGRCRYCGEKISWQYPLVEGATGVLFLVESFGSLRGSEVSLVRICYLLFIICCLIVIFFTDLKYGIIPDKIVYPAVVITLLYSFITNYQLLITNFLPVAVLTAGFFLALIWATMGRGMGLGDAKLSFLIGLFLGFPKVIVALYFAFLTGALVSVILILGRKKKFGQTIAFGPFLVAGILAAMVWGEEILEWLMKIMMQ